MVKLTKELAVVSVKAHHVMHDEPGSWPVGQPPASMGTPDLHAEMELWDMQAFSPDHKSVASFLRSDSEKLGIPFGHDLLGKMLVINLESSPAPIDADGQRINFDNPRLDVAYLKELSLVENMSYASWPTPHLQKHCVLSAQSHGDRSPSGFHSGFALNLLVTEDEYNALKIEAVVPLIFKLTLSCKDQDFSPPKD